MDVVDIVSGFKFCKRRFCKFECSAPKVQQIPRVSALTLSEVGGNGLV